MPVEWFDEGGCKLFGSLSALSGVSVYTCSTSYNNGICSSVRQEAAQETKQASEMWPNISSISSVVFAQTLSLSAITVWNGQLEEARKSLHGSRERTLYKIKSHLGINLIIPVKGWSL